MSEKWSDLNTLMLNNRKYVEAKLKIDPSFFKKLKGIQSPQYLWIGCSDSRVPANEIVGLEPGEMFVHRNIANVVVHSDMNCLSVIHYAVEVLKVKHIIVTGHYGCGGVKAAMENKRMGLIDNWLRNIKDVYRLHETKVNKIEDPEERFRLMCELNVREQVLNVCQTSVVQNAWRKGQDISVHGWIFDIGDGVLHDLGVSINDPAQINKIYHIEE